MAKNVLRALGIANTCVACGDACLQDSGQLRIMQVLHAGDIICEGFVRPLKTDAKAATPASADKATTDAAPANAEVRSTLQEGQVHIYPITWQC